MRIKMLLRNFFYTSFVVCSMKGNRLYLIPRFFGNTQVIKLPSDKVNGYEFKQIIVDEVSEQ